MDNTAQNNEVKNVRDYDREVDEVKTDVRIRAENAAPVGVDKFHKSTPISDVVYTSRPGKPILSKHVHNSAAGHCLPIQLMHNEEMSRADATHFDRNERDAKTSENCGVGIKSDVWIRLADASASATAVENSSNFGLTNGRFEKLTFSQLISLHAGEHGKSFHKNSPTAENNLDSAKVCTSVLDGVSGNDYSFKTKEENATASLGIGSGKTNQASYLRKYLVNNSQKKSVNHRIWNIQHQHRKNTAVADEDLTENCICFREKCTLKCIECGNSFIGRKCKSCPIHPGEFFLMDHITCVKCGIPSDTLQEENAKE